MDSQSKMESLFVGGSEGVHDPSNNCLIECKESNIKHLYEHVASVVRVSSFRVCFEIVKYCVEELAVFQLPI